MSRAWSAPTAWSSPRWDRPSCSTTSAPPPSSASPAVPLARVLEIALRLAHILTGVHAAGVCHRDINPRNIAYDRTSSEVFLIDFGLGTRLSRHGTDATPLGQLEGTLGYLSPEQTGRMNRSVDRRSDLYSLGVTLYELLVGRRPFDSPDPMEVLHATVAREPRPPREAQPEVPEVLSGIIMRLLAKDAEERYQNAAALADDLQRCEELLTADGRIAAFELGTTDQRGTFAIPERIYGREHAIGTLEAALRRSVDGTTAFVGIAGPTGSGKTALSRELMPRLSEGGMLVSGVCSALDRTPYGPVVQVLRSIMAGVVEGGLEHRPLRRARLEAAVQGNGGLLLRLLPEAEPIIGPQPDPVDIPPAEARERILTMIVRLLRATHEPRAPLVLFLDDLQWADEGTLGVLEALLASDSVGGPLVLMAWRDDEVSADHALNRLLTEQVEQITLRGLDLEAAGQLVGDALGLSPDQVRPLAVAVHDKSGGNVFFLRQLLASLEESGLVTFDSTALRWTWSLDGIADLPPTHNVADLLSRQLTALPDGAQLALGVAASLGRGFELEMLSQVSGIDPRPLCGHMVSALQAGLLVADGHTLGMIEALTGPDGTAGSPDAFDPAARLSFVHDAVHDAVHEAALASVQPDLRLGFRLAAGSLLLNRFEQGAFPPFEPADHLIATADQLSDPAERSRVVALLHAAGTRAADAAAFPAAVHYFEAGARLTSDADWADQHGIAFDLHLRAGEAMVMCPGRTPEVDFTAVAMARARDELERIAVQRVRILAHVASYEFDQSLDLSLEALSWVGVSLPRGANLAHLAMALLRTTLKVRGRSLDDLRALPANEDPKIDATMQLLTDTATVTYQTNAILLPVLLCRMVDISMAHGVGGATAFACAGWAFLQVVTRGDVASAKMWGTFARELVERFDAHKLKPKVELLVIGFVESQTEPPATLAPRFQRNSWLAREVGDAEYAALHAMNHTTFSFMGGVALSEVKSRGVIDLAVCEELGQEQAANYVRMTLQLIACLRGEAAHDGRLVGEWFDAESARSRMEDKADKAGIASILMWETHSMLMTGDLDALIETVQRGARAMKDLPASMQVPAFMLHASLAWARQMRRSGRVGGKPLATMKKYQKKLTAMAREGPGTFSHKATLVEAEIADLRGDVAAAQLLYEDAIRKARASGILQEEALCLETAAQAAARFGHQRLAASLARDAAAAWAAWGIPARLQALQEAVGPSDARTMTTNVSVGHSVTSTITSSGGLDVASVVKASQAVSGQIDLVELLRTLMRIILENAGATSGLLVLNTGDRLAVAAHARLEPDGAIEVDISDPEDRAGVEATWPKARRLVDEVARKHNTRVVHDGTNEPATFGGAEAPPRSALCLPVRKGRNLVGVLYLENSVARHAFTAQRSEIVGVLCSQAAVSIENATLYTDLQHALERQRQITRSFERFVPKQFLEQLGHDSILDVDLGDQVEREMAVLFMDIRNFTTLSEQLTAKETFELVNMLLARLGPIVRRHGGFIDKYIGDAIMALFPGPADDAVRAALDIQRSVASVRAASATGPRTQLRVGVGVHRGVTMLGTIGEAERMDSTVISDAVNIASRIEGLTKTLGVGIAISQETVDQIDDKGAFAFRHLGRADVKGKSDALGVHEVLDPLHDSVDAKKMETVDELALGVSQLEAGDRKGARASFVRVLAFNPDDAAVQVLLERTLGA